MTNNCSDIVGEALKAAGLLDRNAATTFPGLTNSYMMLRAMEGRVSVELNIPKGASEGWNIIDDLIGPFDPLYSH